MKDREQAMRWIISPTTWLSALLVLFQLLVSGNVLQAGDEQSTNRIFTASTSRPLADALSPGKWRQVENSVDRALAWLASQQAADGSFPTLPQGQPGVTSLCVLAFLSRGHQPGVGLYGEPLNRAIDYVLACQLPDGLLSKQVPGPAYVNHQASHTSVYDHAISGLMLGEVYGQVSGQRARNVKEAIQRALQFTRAMQVQPKSPADRGGWRYVRPDPPSDSDLSITAWQLMFLRSAKNAEFSVPQEYVDEAMAYVRRCWDRQSGGFNYALAGGVGFAESRGMVGAGIVSLAMGGDHQSPMARAAGDWLLAHPYLRFGERIGPYDKFFYSTYYCSQAAAQLGGRYWEKFFPPMVEALLGAQRPDGSWPPEPGGSIAVFGNAFTTAMAVLSLTPPYQLLPVYQR
jgi:Prenyltransferase and squalene oxidase repeat